MFTRLKLSLAVVVLALGVAGCRKPADVPGNNVSVAANLGVPTGGVCGGIAGTTCSAAGDYCKHEVGKCGVADAQGVCTTRPTECTYEYVPVCGCDGKTYGNACAASAAGVSVQATGACQVPANPESNVALGSVQIVPVSQSATARDYCRMADRPGGGKDLIVRLRNPPGPAKAAMPMTVAFGGTPAPVSLSTPPLAMNASANVKVAIPGGCLTGDCRFVIKVQDPAGAVQAEGNCIG